MVLYCVQHPAGILRAIIHKFKYHESEEAIIFGEYKPGSVYYPKIDKITYYEMPNVYDMVTYSQDKITEIEYIKRTVDVFMNNIKLSFSDFSDIYAIYDMFNPFTVYFEIMSIKYMCIELNANVFNYYWANNFVDERNDIEHCFNTLVKTLHSQDGQGENCIKGFLFSNESEVPKGGKVPVEIFDYYNELLSLNNSCKNQLIEAYHLNNFSFDSIMLFNSPGWTMTVFRQYNVHLSYDNDKESKKNIFLFYKEVIDYYFKNIKFALKLHPASGLDFVNEFNHFKQIPPNIYVELFAILNRHFTIYCPIQSTGIEIFKKIGFDVNYFGVNIVPFFKYIHFINLILTYYNKFKKLEKIYIYNIDLEQLQYFINWASHDFKAIQFIKLTQDNAKDADCCIAVCDTQLNAILQLLPNNCILGIYGNFESSFFLRQNMKCSIFDISNADKQEIYSFDWAIASKNLDEIKVASHFNYSYILDTARLMITTSPNKEIENKLQTDNSIIKDKLLHDKEIKNMCGLLQLYYEAEHYGYTLRDYFEERGLLEDAVKIAYFATDELGILVYRICERCGIHFTVLASDNNRTIKYQTHGNLTESLNFQKLDSIDKNLYTHVFMATTWNQEQIKYVGEYCSSLFLFDAVVSAMYTRVFFINKIASIKNKYTGVHVGIFFTPYIHQIPGPHSEIEEYFMQQGQNMPNITYIKDAALSDKVKDACYRSYGFDDDYIENVCNIGYPILSYNGVYLLQDHRSKYSNVINHRRVTTDNPQNFNNTIYFFGDSCVTGLHVGDAETIESNFQRLINSNNLPYIVQNCANSYGLRYDWIFSLTDTMQFKPGDILLFCSRVDWLTEQYIKQNDQKLLCNILGIYTTTVFQRPHNHGELFTDDHHCNGNGYGLIAKKIFNDLQSAGFFYNAKSTNAQRKPQIVDISSKQQDQKINKELKVYIDNLKQYLPRIGSIVMNCNPFTLGHRYLIEYAASRVDRLYIFVVEEDKSFFPFKDRFELVKKGTADLKNVVVIPSGRFIISSLTFQQYFEKGEKQDVTVDASGDVEIFAKQIAPTLHINVRFAGQEPLDNVTNQYNDTMRAILPQYGITFEEIPRKTQGSNVISASRVRKLLQQKNFHEIKKLVPKTTLEYLVKNFSK